MRARRYVRPIYPIYPYAMVRGQIRRPYPAYRPSAQMYNMPRFIGSMIGLTLLTGLGVGLINQFGKMMR